MKIKFKVGAVAVFALVSSLCLYLWKQGEPRRTCVDTLQNLSAALDTANISALRPVLVMPTALQGRTQAEQAEFILKVLGDELSSEGVAFLKKEGRFGPLKEVFPAEADGWARHAGVNPEECMAFKAERHGLRAEVVLVRNFAPSTRNFAFQILRCNNVKQLAENL